MAISNLLGLFATTIDFSSTQFQYSCEIAVLLPIILALLAIFSEPYTSRVPRARALIGSNLLFLILVFLCIGWCQLPVLCANFQLNHPDEPGIISQAYTLSRDPVFWHSIEGGTNGPLTSWPLTLPMLFGLSPEYSLARVVALGMVLVCVWSLFNGARLLYGSHVARISVLPFVVFFSLSRHADFVQYSSHHASLMLLSAAFYLSARVFRPKPSPSESSALSSLLLAGMCLGGLPMAKLQYAYMSVYGMSVLLLLVWNACCKGVLPKKAILIAALGYGCMPLLFIGSAFFVGAFNDFLTRYILANVSYVAVGHLPVLTSMGSMHLDYSLWASTSFREYFRPLLMMFSLFLVGTITLDTFRPEKRHRCFLAVTLGLWLISVYSACAPGRPFGHYALVVVVPSTLLLIAMVGFAATARFPASRNLRALVVVVFVVLTVKPEFEYFNSVFPSVYDTPPSSSRHQMMISSVSIEAMKHSSPGQRMAMWGYKPSLFVETQLLQGTKEYASYYQMRNTPYKRYYVRSYIQDMERTTPQLFIDVVGQQTWDEYRDRTKHSHEFYRPVARYIAENYELVADIDDIRIYRRKPAPS